MRLDDIVWEYSWGYDANHHILPRHVIYRCRHPMHLTDAGEYMILPHAATDETRSFRGLDPIAAQAIIYELLKEVTP